MILCVVQTAPYHESLIAVWCRAQPLAKLFYSLACTPYCVLRTGSTSAAGGNRAPDVASAAFFLWNRVPFFRPQYGVLVATHEMDPKKNLSSYGVVLARCLFNQISSICKFRFERPIFILRRELSDSLLNCIEISLPVLRINYWIKKEWTAWCRSSSALCGRCRTGSVH